MEGDALATVAQAEPAATPAVPAAPGLPELSPKDKKRVREEARREFKAAELERLGKAAEKKTALAAPSAASAAAPVEPTYTDAQLREAAAVFLRGVLFPVLSVLVLPFGFRLELEKFTEPASRDDAAAWVPVLRLYGWLRTVVVWASVPARLVARVRELKVRRERPAAKGEGATVHPLNREARSP
jgi:hypothetical protein